MSHIDCGLLAYFRKLKWVAPNCRPEIFQRTGPAARDRGTAENRGCASSACGNGARGVCGGDAFPAGRNGITTGRRKRFPPGSETGQDGDELKTQTDRDEQNQEALWALCARSIFCAARAAASPSFPPPGEALTMNERSLAFLYSPEIEALSYPPDCPFKTQRAGLARLRLKSLGLLGDENRFEFEPRRASFTELKQFHTAHYLEEMRRAADGDLTVDGLRMGFGGPDTPVFKDMFECGAWACGAGFGRRRFVAAKQGGHRVQPARRFSSRLPRTRRRFLLSQRRGARLP